METLRVNASLRRGGMLILSVSCSIVFAAPILGQSVGDPAKAQMQEMTRRELQLDSLGKASGPIHDPKRSQAMMDQVGEDFERILILHNEIVRAITAKQSLSYKFIFDATGEIKKRATRLQAALRLPKPEPPTKTDFPMSETKDELIRLCRQIESFITNPIIEKPGTVDVQQLGKARQDLQSVVEISDAIKKKADKLKP